MKSFLSLLLVLYFLFSWTGGGEGRKKGSSNKGNCDVCKDFVKNFENGLKDTEKNSFAGGDTSWEEENQKTYSKSEVRLVEIMDGICSTNDYKCSRFVETYEEDIERWWLKLKENGHPDLLQWLCYNHSNVCCPSGTYGPECTECPGGKDNPCNGHGTCKGQGEKDERKGSGTCACYKGYRGDLCDSCTLGYYMEEDQKSCRKCNKACLKGCSGPGPEACAECAKGYKREEEGGPCEDIDECNDEDTVADCSGGTYCINKPGSYQCEKCDSACRHSCTGPGNEACVDCASGYRNDSGACKDINECEDDTAKCKDGTYCDNTQGSFLCQDCDRVCDGPCTGGGPSGCVSCKDGYKMENGRCEDIDECVVSSVVPCDEDSERCVNSPGSYSCKCKAGYTRYRGECKLWEEAERLRNQDPPENKKKKKKNTSKAQEGASPPGEQSETVSLESGQASNAPTDSSINSNSDVSVVMTSSSDTTVADSVDATDDTVQASATPSATPPSTHEEL